MGPDTHAPASPVDVRCPHCRGAVRPEAPWCTQCWADLRPPPEPVAATPPPAPASPVPVAGPLTPAVGADARPSAARGWPCSGCGETNAVELDACAACGTGFLAGLRKEAGPVLALPVVGDITRLSRAQRLGMSAAFVAVFLLLIALLGLIPG